MKRKKSMGQRFASTNTFCSLYIKRIEGIEGDRVQGDRENREYASLKIAASGGPGKIPLEDEKSLYIMIKSLVEL